MLRSPIAALAGAALALAVSCSAVAAQSLPLPAPPAPSQPHESKPDCSAKGVKSMEDQLAQLENLEKVAPDTIAMVCQGIDLATGLMGWKDDEPIDGPLADLVRKHLSQPLTPRMIKAMCRQAQGEAGRNLKTEIGQLKDRLLSCRGV
jgi:hypothetical protein